MKNIRLPSYIKPERYKIRLNPNLDEFIFTGEETIYFILEKTISKITLHAADLEITSAEFIHVSKEIWAGKITYNEKAETVTCSFPKELPIGKGELHITFKGILNDKMRGFYRSKYEAAGVTKHLAVTQFESTDARRAFPCFDEPCQKAVFEVSLMIPPNTTAISNTIETSIKEHVSGYQIMEFAPTPKMSTYLLAFLVGEFEHIEGKSKEGVLVRVFTTPGKKSQAKFALEVGKKCMDFYHRYFDIAYPLPVLNMIAIPDFAAGAMENWGAVTYRESTLLVDEERSSTANKQWVALVIAHELAHQWFGNLVTMQWWSDLWLNEGFASFIEYLAIDSIFPDWDIWTQFVSSEMGDAFVLDSLKNTHPIEIEVFHPAEISEIFDKVSYAKGAAVLRMLWQYLGEKDFQKGLQYYLKKYSYGNASTKDLWESLEQVSGKPVGKVMKNWTTKPGHPLVSINYKVKSKKLELTQSRFYSSSISQKESKDKTIWAIPLKVQISLRRQSYGASATNLKTQNYMLNRKTLIIDEPQDGEWIKLNSGETSFIRIDYPQKHLRNLEKAIKSGKLSASDRLGLIRDSFSLAQSDNSPTSFALELALVYKDEEDYTVWSVLTDCLSQLDSLLALESFHDSFKKYGREIYSRITKKLGWQSKVGEKHTNSLLRGIVLYQLGAFGDGETIQKAQELFYSSGRSGFSFCHPERLEKDLPRSGKIVTSPSTRRLAQGPRNDKNIDPDLRSAVYSLVAENGGEKESNTLLKMYKEQSNQQEKDRIARSLGHFKQKQLLEKTLAFSISQHVRFQNSLQIIAAVWGNPNGRYLAWEFVKKNWELLKDRYAGGHYFTKVFAPAGQFTKVADAKDIQKFVNKNPVPEAKRTIAQALEQIYSNAQWFARDRERISKFLK